MASVPYIVHDPYPYPHFLTPGSIGRLCSHRLVEGEAYKRPAAFPEYWLGTLLHYASQEYFTGDTYEFAKEIFDFIRCLPNWDVFNTGYRQHECLYGLDLGQWPSFSVFSPNDRLRIMRRAVRLLWEVCWYDWLFSIDLENQLQLYEDSEWAVLQGIPPNQTAYERQRTTALRWILRHPYQAAEQIAEASQRQYRATMGGTS